MWCPTNLLMLVPEDSQHMADMLMEYRQAYSHL